jgi:hypothetical protein
MSKSKCPYCADPDLLDKILNPPAGTLYSALPGASIRRFGNHWPKVRKPVKSKPSRGVKLLAVGVIDRRKVVTLKTPGVHYGKYIIKTVTDKDMIARYAGFIVKIIGVKCKTEPPVPSGPFLSRTWTVEGNGKGSNYVSFNATRITHQDSPIVIDIHWTPEHGRVVTVRGFSSYQSQPEELAIINRAFEFYRAEKRGGAKIDRENLMRAVREQGDKVTQKAVADELGVTTRAIRDQLARLGATWDELKQESTGAT